MVYAEKSPTTGGVRGFTLVEVVVSSALLMMVFLALLSAISFARRMQSLTENRLACLHVARQYMEPFSRMMYDSEDFAPGTIQLPDNRGTCVIAQDGSAPIRDVTVTIEWVEPSGSEHSVSLKSSFTRSLHR